MKKLPALGSRLEMLYEMIPPCDVFADIGADHAYLAIHLLRDNKVKRAVLSELSLPALNRARANAAKFGVDSRCEFVLADGFAGIPRGVDVVNISGLGADTMAGILSGDRHNILNVALVLSPNRDCDIIRAKLLSLSYNIVSERIALSNGRYYVALLANVCESPFCSDIMLGERKNQLDAPVWRDYFAWLSRVHKNTAPALSSLSEIERKEWLDKLAAIDERVAELSQI